MPAPYSVVCRVAPLKRGNLRGAHVHQAREHAHEMPNLDPTRLGLNRWLHGSGNVLGDVDAMLSQHQMAHPDGSVCAELILSADDDYFDRICPGWRSGATSKAFETWVRLNTEWLQKTYPGLSSAVLHMDEGAPHIHAMVVPLASYEQSYRRGSKQVTKVHYNRIFGDDAQTIALARKTQNSELTKLGRLQTAYADAMKPCRLVRGIKNSRAHHRKVKEHQNLVNTPVNTPRIPKMEVIERSISDTFKARVGIDNDTDKRIAESKTELVQYRKDLAQYQKQLGAKAKEFDTMKAQNDRMKSELVLKDATIAKLTEQLDLSKDEIAKLRQYPLQDVAIALNYQGSLTREDGKPQWRNAIDMVKELAGLDYAKSVAFLYHELGNDSALYAVSNHAIDAGQDAVKRIADGNTLRPYTKQEFAIRAELDKQLACLNSEKYRITLMHGNNTMTYNYGKGRGPDGTERLYEKDQVLDLVPRLNNENWRRGYNVFITPLDPGKHYVLIDDLTSSTLVQMKEDGYRPNLVQQSSAQSIQAVFEIPKSEVDKEVGNAWFKDMNLTYGDAGIRGFIHPFRAAGFRNVKPKHLDQATARFPAVRLLERVKGVCRAAVAACKAIAEATVELTPGRGLAAPKKALEHAVYAVEAQEPGSELEAYAARFYGWCGDRWGEGVDWSKADWMLVQRMREAGHSPDIIAGTIQACSPGLAERHPDREQYAARTVASAATPKP